MSRLDITAEVPVYQENNDDWGASHSKLTLETYWNDDGGEFVVVVVPGGKSFTVSAKTLTAAIRAVTTR